MHVRLVSRAALADVELPSDGTVGAGRIAQMLDAGQAPDGCPFLIDAEWNLRGLDAVNTYLLDAARQRAFTPANLRSHAYALRAVLTFVRERHGGPVDLTAITRQDLVAYRDLRIRSVSEQTWNDDLSRIGSFLAYAVRAKWIENDPTPRWGAQQRNTLVARVRTHRRERFLSEAQLRLFLSAGLRGEPPAPRELRPEYPQRDYSLGLLMVSTGLRRQEAAYVLDCEIPRTSDMPASGIQSFNRLGKNGRVRTVWVTDQTAQQIDLYRDTERARIVRAAQPSLRQALKEGRATLFELTRNRRGAAEIVIDGRRMEPDRLDDERRQTAVSRRLDGTLDPLGLFVVEGGRAPALRTINNLFNDAAGRLAAFEHPDLPPEHLDITPHVLRHTFAVRMLAALMQTGRERAGDPYRFLSSPVFVVQQLLGHADVSTTQWYLHAAERYTADLPSALLAAATSAVASTTGVPHA